jgi:hypothetical protein
LTEWKKQLALVPDEVIKKTLAATTQYYLTTEAETRQDPRRHLKSRLPGLRLPRQHETVATDTFFLSITSDRGNTCSQFFVGVDTNRWEVYPLKTKSHNGTALQDYTQRVGAPRTLKSDRAQSEVGSTWTKHCQDACIETKSTEPHSPWQNPAEKQIGTLGSMVRNVMRTFKVPLKKHDWVQKWVCDVHNILANRRLGWRTPLEKSEGHLQDISRFRFHMWEPIWYYEPKTKQPANNLKKARWLGFATSAGNAFTYYIQTKKDPGEGRNVILIQSIIRTRRKNIGTENEYCCNNPDLAGFFLSIQDLEETETSFMSPQDMDPGELDPGETQMDQEVNQESLAPIPELNETPNEDNSDKLPDDEDAQHLYDQFEG